MSTTSDADASDAARKNELTGILWLASYPKSGNTWTRHFLHNLLNILEGTDGGDAYDINRMNELTFWEISSKPYERLIGKPIAEATKAEIASVRPKVQEEIAEGTDGIAMIKTHQSLVMDRGAPTINFGVTAGAVYIVRNPLDVAISLASYMGGTIDDAITMMQTEGLETIVEDDHVHEVYGSWSEHVESWTRKPHPTICVMRYEDMLADPLRIFGSLARFMLLKPREDQLRLAIERSSFETLKKQEEESGFKERPDKTEIFFRSGKSGEWQDKLTRRQVREIVRVHHKQMARFGYLTDELKHLAGASSSDSR